MNSGGASAAASSTAAPHPPEVAPEAAPDGGAAQMIECGVCFCDTPRAETVTLCKHGHRFCVDCAFRCCKVAVLDGLVPACPREKEARCGAVSKADAEEALTRHLRETKGEAKARKAELQAGGWALHGGSKGARFTSERIDAVYLSAERAEQGAVQCIGKNCHRWYVPPIPHAQHLPQRIVCDAPKCGASFCAACRHPYHFRTDCAEALRVQARWVRWLQHELPPFLRAAVKVDPDRYAPILKGFLKSQGALDEATKEALARFDELRKMERWKEQHCRHCPHCKRVVERTGGCTLMVCGGNYHGGNAQRGCGKGFDWNRAKPYVADLRSHGDDAPPAAAGAEGGAEGDSGGGGGGGGATPPRRPLVLRLPPPRPPPPRSASTAGCRLTRARCTSTHPARP